MIPRLTIFIKRLSTHIAIAIIASIIQCQFRWWFRPDKLHQMSSLLTLLKPSSSSLKKCMDFMEFCLSLTSISSKKGKHFIQATLENSKRGINYQTNRPRSFFKKGGRGIIQKFRSKQDLYCIQRWRYPIFHQMTETSKKRILPLLYFTKTEQPQSWPKPTSIK